MLLDDELIIETPERVELYFVLANIGNRFLAAAIDHLIQIVVGLTILLIAGALTSWNLFDNMNDWTAALTVLSIFSLYWGYFVFFETVWNGQTPGKRIMKLRVVREDGRPVRFFEIFVRNLIRLVIDMAPPFTYAVGVVSIIFSTRSKRIGDFVAGTVVVKERATEAPSLEEIIKISEIEQEREARVAVAPFNADTRQLTERETQAVETFLKRRYELAPAQRVELAARLAVPIAQKLGIQNDDLGHEAILEEIERQHRVKSRYVD